MSCLQTVQHAGEGEDQHSISKQELLLVTEGKKIRPRIETMMGLMERTVKFREEKMADMRTADVLEEFPYLKLPKLVCITVYIYIYEY